MIFKRVESYITEAVKNFDSISEARKKILEQISGYVQAKVQTGKDVNLIYVCTHNSRRSHLGQVWGKTAAFYYGISNVKTYSAGTEATAFNPNAIRALERAGFKITNQNHEKNPLYSVFFSEGVDPVLCYSKTYEDKSIPQNNLCAVMTCTEADGNCPFIPGTELHICCSYDDPKAFDGTPQQEEKYDERCQQIAIENLYIFSLIKK